MNVSSKGKIISRPRAATANIILILIVVSTVYSVWPRMHHAQASSSLVKTGWFYVRWGDNPASDAVAIKYFLVADTGTVTELSFDPKLANSLSLVSFDRRRVNITGTLINDGMPTFNVQNISLDMRSADSRNAALSGNKKWVTILCRFADSASSTPAPASYFQSLMSNSQPGMDHYWRETSNGNISITGSLVVGWYTLPQPRSYYIHGSPARFDFNLAEPDAINLADPDVFFPDYYGINFVFNQELDGFYYGGTTFVSKDGLSNQLFGATDLAPGAFFTQSLVAHEMGHAFGLEHSSGPYSTPYDSQWDPMSSTGTCSLRDPTFGCVAAGTIGYHKDKLGWIPPSRKYIAGPGTSLTFNLERLELPASSSNYLLAQIPISATSFYTVESRMFSGYDNQVPGQAVVIHQVDLTRGDRTAEVVDPDNNGDPNDAGARWTQGETFSDPAHGVQVAVNAQNASSFTVTIANSCAYSLSSGSTSISASGGTGSVTVAATNSCGWTAASNTGWITLTTPVNNAGNGLVNFSVLANTTAIARVGTITVAGQTFTVNQPAAAPQPPPALLVDEVTGRAAALDSVILLRDAFSVVNPFNFSLDQRSRVTLFATNGLDGGDTTVPITAQAEDAQHVIYPLEVESAAIVPNFTWLTQIVVKLPDALAGHGDVQVSINMRNQTSNKVIVRIR